MISAHVLMVRLTSAWLIRCAQFIGLTLKQYFSLTNYKIQNSKFVMIQYNRLIANQLKADKIKCKQNCRNV